MKLLLSIISVICLYQLSSCTSKNNSVAATTELVNFESDTVVALNKLFEAYSATISQNDTLAQKKAFEPFYNGIDSFSFIENFPYQTLTNYCQKGIQAASIKANGSTVVLNRHISRLVQYQMFFYSVLKNNEKIVFCFNELNKPHIRSTIDDLNYLERLMDVGAAYNQLGDNQQAQQFYLQTIAQAKKLQRINDVAKANINLNKLRSQNKQYDSIIKESTPFLNQQVETKIKASLCGDIALAFFYKNDLVNALKYNQQTFSLLTRLPKDDQPADIDQRLGAAFAIKATVNTNATTIRDESYNKAMLHYRKYTNNKGREVAKLFLKIGDYLAQNANSTIIGNPTLYYNKALQALGIPVNDNDTFAMPKSKQLYAENTLFEICDAKASYLQNINKGAKQPEKILALYDISFEVERKLLNYFIYDNAKINFVNESRTRTAKALALCYILYHQQKSEVWLNKALAYIENSKSIVLIDKLKQSLLLSNSKQQDSLVSLYNKLQKQRADIYATDNTFSKDSALSAINQKIQIVAIEIEKSNPQFRQLTHRDNISTVAEVRNKLLKKSTIAINYFLQDSTHYGIAIANDAVYFHQNLKFDASIILQYKTQIADAQTQINQPQVFLNTSFKVYQMLFPNEFSNTKALLISPDAQLFGLSFDALLTKKAISSNYATQPYLIQSCAIRYGFSLSSLLYTAGSSFSKNKLLAVAPVTQVSSFGKEALPNSELELDAIQKAGLPTIQLKHKDANFYNFNTQIRYHNLIHIASHAMYNVNRNSTSIDFFDTTLSTHFFYGAGLQHVRLFFLSACETSLGQQVGSEGNLSLARSVYYAGAQNVISTHWKINDASTANIVSNFYANSRKASFSNALQASKLLYLRSSTQEKAAPYYWAAFNIIGIDDSSSISFFHKYKILIFGAIALLIGVSVFIVIRPSKNTK
jgi:CHAT domain-containing protein